MLKVVTRFRCDLCGKFSASGVTESEASNPTTVCGGCVARAVVVLVEDDRYRNNGPTPRGAKA